jgi:hypothetical protein
MTDNTGTRLVSPDEMLAAAKEEMLKGCEPRTWDDWARVLNFVAFNVPAEVAGGVCHLMAILYDMPLCDDEITAIVLFQNAKRGPRS